MAKKRGVAPETDKGLAKDPTQSRDDSSTQSAVEVNFEEALGELEGIVRRLEQGGGALEDALRDYSQAIELLKTCHGRLERAERRIEILSGVDAQGNPITEVIEESETNLEQKQQSRSRRRSVSTGSSHSSQADGDAPLFS